MYETKSTHLEALAHAPQDGAPASATWDLFEIHGPKRPQDLRRSPCTRPRTRRPARLLQPFLLHRQTKDSQWEVAYMEMERMATVMEVEARSAGPRAGGQTVKGGRADQEATAQVPEAAETTETTVVPMCPSLQDSPQATTL